VICCEVCREITPENQPCGEHYDGICTWCGELIKKGQTAEVADGDAYCAECVFIDRREVEEELALVSHPDAVAAVKADSLAGKAGR
jgi:hypothetical protein